MQALRRDGAVRRRDVQISGAIHRKRQELIIADHHAIANLCQMPCIVALIRHQEISVVVDEDHDAAVSGAAGDDLGVIRLGRQCLQPVGRGDRLRRHRRHLITDLAQAERQRRLQGRIQIGGRGRWREPDLYFAGALAR